MNSRFILHGISQSPPTYRVALFLTMIGETYDYIHISFKDGEQKSPAYLALQRFGQVPLLIDAERDLKLVQSGSILMYLSETFGKFQAASEADRIKTREWIFWEWDALARGIFRVRGVRSGRRKMDQATVDYYIGEAKTALAVLEIHLAGRQWMVGATPTIADIDLYATVGYAEQAGYDLGEYPSLKSWMSRFEALPGFRGVADLLPAQTTLAA